LGLERRLKKIVLSAWGDSGSDFEGGEEEEEEEDVHLFYSHYHLVPSFHFPFSSQSQAHNTNRE
jgi:hypothetical protein